MKSIQVEVKTVYGKDKIYPVNEAAQILASIAGTKTLSPQTIEYANAIGLKVVEVKRNYGAISKLLGGVTA